jgi:hypothetical protein
MALFFMMSGWCVGVKAFQRHIYKSDVEVAKKLVKKGGYIIIDDTNIDYISKDVDDILKTNLFEEVRILQTVGYQHRVIRKV